MPTDVPPTDSSLPLPLPGPAPLVPSATRAEVRFGETIAGYQRAGTGKPVVVLVRRAALDDVVRGVIGALASRFRFVVPELPPPPAALDEWLALFMDGVGLIRTAVLCDRELSSAVAALTSNDPDRVERLVLLGDDGIAPGDPPGAEASLAEHGIPWCIVPLTGDPRAVVDTISRFLDQSEPRRA